MSRWGNGAFESDHVMDWYCRLKKQRDVMPGVVAALDWVYDNQFYDQFDIGIGAAEIVASLGGYPMKSEQVDMLSGPVDVTFFVSDKLTSNLIEKAIIATKVVLDRPAIITSWHRITEDDVKQWRANMLNLQTRLKKCLREQRRKELSL